MSEFINLNRIEYVITDACSGRCKHCSNGERSSRGESVRAEAAVDTVKKLARRFSVRSVMTFGGEPLLHWDTVCQIHRTARDCGIPRRQIITNGFFSKDEEKIDTAAEALCAAGVNDILLSVDVFHQEYIPLPPVISFAEALVRHKAPSLRAQPAWLVNENHENPYNTETKRLLQIFTDMGIRTNEGNNIFPSGNALKHLGEYFPAPDKIDLTALCGAMPYTTRLDEVSCIGINPNGDVNLCSVTIGNIYNKDILDIADEYNPHKNPALSAVLNGGAAALLQYAKGQGVTVDTGGCRSACGVCRTVMAALREKENVYGCDLRNANPARNQNNR
ncbi:MAG: radical SAM protein [Clostridiales bacterium]|jgi:MoaA/NifB/PqqE/SkfB family radical SAM enzyme|nr:radical SAM protein [Clostridiales bacterium]